VTYDPGPRCPGGQAVCDDPFTGGHCEYDVVPGDVARVLQSAGFVERDDWHELIYTSPKNGG
jgi:hypothetical protein